MNGCIVIVIIIIIGISRARRIRRVSAGRIVNQGIMISVAWIGRMIGSVIVIRTGKVIGMEFIKGFPDITTVLIGKREFKGICCWQPKADTQSMTSRGIGRGVHRCLTMRSPVTRLMKWCPP